ncbi:MAG: hypothetical protein H0W42_12555 [Gemmatimonadaceae bacterium]|nr:hypothetical protein [Gemmatimonadaceae bacterium]
MILSDGTVVSRAEVSPHKFGGDPMAEYLWLLTLEQGSSDEYTGDACDWHYIVHRFGRRLLICYSSGFVDVQVEEDEQAAIEAFEMIDAEYSAYMGDEE